MVLAVQVGRCRHQGGCSKLGRSVGISEFTFLVGVAQIGVLSEWLEVSSMPDLPEENDSDFARKFLLRHPNLLLESRCRLCGLSIIANDSESLEKDEFQHRETCHPK